MTTPNLSLIDPILKRCAICKIDLKGRLVYIDDKFESILGRTKEDLFGSSIFEFLDKSSHEIIEQLLSLRNHYETFYDSTQLTIINNNQEKISARVVVSLNFNAGNPVNFQLIIDPCMSNQIEHTDSLSGRYKDLLEGAILLNRFIDYQRILKLIIEFSKVPRIFLYQLNNQKLELLNSFFKNADMEKADDYDTSQLHLDVVENKEEYSFIDKESVQDAVEKYGLAPNEYLTPFDINDGSDYLVRIIFDEDTKYSDAQGSIERVRTAVGLIVRILSTDRTTEESDNGSFDLKFTIGFLDSLSIPAMLIDKNGDLVGYNPSLMNMFDETTLNGTYVKIFDKIAKYNQDGMVNKIIDYVTSPIGDDDGKIFNVRVNISNTLSKKLGILKISDSITDLTSCFVFMPSLKISTGVQKPIKEFDHLHSIIKFVKTELRKSSSTADDLAHRLYNKFSEKENKLISGYAGDIRKLEIMINKLETTYSYVESQKQSSLIDLNLIIDSIVMELKSSYPSIEIELSYNNLPKIKSIKGILNKILNELLTNAVKFNQAKTVKITISAQMENSIYQLSLSDNGPGISKKDLPGVLRLDKRILSDKEKNQSGIGLPLVKILLDSLKGEILIDSVQSKGTTVTLKLPIAE